VLSVDPKAVERPIQLSKSTTCSASAVLGKTAQLTTSYQIVEEQCG
jgi:uncharacterized OsmC-like protein